MAPRFPSGESLCWALQWYQLAGREPTKWTTSSLVTDKMQHCIYLPWPFSVIIVLLCKLLSFCRSAWVAPTSALGLLSLALGTNSNPPSDRLFVSLMSFHSGTLSKHVLPQNLQVVSTIDTQLSCHCAYWSSVHYCTTSNIGSYM